MTDLVLSLHGRWVCERRASGARTCTHAQLRPAAALRADRLARARQGVAATPARAGHP